MSGGPISTAGRRRYEPKFSEGDVPHEAEALLDTESLMEKTFLDNMPRSAVKAIERGNSRALEASTSGNSAFGEVASGEITKTASAGRASDRDYYEADNSITNREGLLMSLFDIHDELISAFEKIPDDQALTANEVSGSINKIGSCIRELGGDINSFSPIDHVSGLAAPSLDKSAEIVIATTKQLYKRATIESAHQEDNSIHITFAGEENGVLYRTSGTITPKYCWNGNEALDYIYSHRSGKMSVKVFENRKWVDKSDNYKISWDIPNELDVQRASSEDIMMFKNASKAPVPETPQAAETPNQDHDIDLDFAVEEKNDK